MELPLDLRPSTQRFVVIPYGRLGHPIGPIFGCQEIQEGRRKYRKLPLGFRWLVPLHETVWGTTSSV